MAGHSKWASIKHKKAATDAKRGKLFTKLARAITVAAREGGGDPAGNHTLAAAVEKAKSYSMPKDNIQRAIDKGTGEGEAGTIERVLYEGYGPAGTALLVEALTDNRNRTGSEVRNAFDRHGGNLGEPGSVAWQFEKKGVVLLDGSRYGEDDVIGAIDAGAEDVVEDEDTLKVTCEPQSLTAVREALTSVGRRDRVRRARDGAPERGRGDRRRRGAASHPPDRHARRPRRRRRGPLELRHLSRADGRGGNRGVKRFFARSEWAITKNR